MSDCGCEIEIKNKEEIRVLKILFVINVTMFFIEITLGFISDSTALIADSLDMLADATVYGISLYAVGKAALVKIKAAHISGFFQISLGVALLIDIVRRALYGSDPGSLVMIAVGCVALIANIICLQLISKHKDGDVHMRASWVFSKNDVIANLGIILGGGLVHQFDSRFPDLIIGLVISVIVMQGGLSIIKDAYNEKRNQSGIR